MQFKEILEGIDLWVAILWVLFIVAIFTAVSVFLWKAFPIVKKFIVFVNDVAGEDARPGFPARPGLFDRIHSIETTQNAVADKVDRVHHELFPNSGKSLRDQTNRIEQKVSADYREITKLKVAVNTVEKQLSEHLELSTGILNTLKEEE